MNKYRILFKEKVMATYEVFVEADNEKEAEQKVWDGDYYFQDLYSINEIESEDINIISVKNMKHE